MRILLLIIMFLYDSIAAGRETGLGLVEISPLRVSMGMVGVRAESSIFDNAYVGGDIQQVFGASQWGERPELLQTMQLEGLYYLPKEMAGRFFMGSGLTLVRHEKIYRRERNYVSDIRYHADKSYDSWSVESRHLHTALFMGYRYNFGSYLTASLRLYKFNFLSGNESVKNREIESSGFEPVGSGVHYNLPAIMAFLGMRIF